LDNEPEREFRSNETKESEVREITYTLRESGDTMTPTAPFKLVLSDATMKRFDKAPVALFRSKENTLSVE